MRVSDFTYKLPQELIAQYPPKVRGSSRLLVLDSATGNVTHERYFDMLSYLSRGDVVVLNDTKVIKARLIALNSSGQPRELLLIEDHQNKDLTRRKVVYRGKIRVGEILRVKKTNLTIEAIHEDSTAEISSQINLLDLAEHEGTVPLPPYMRRGATPDDIERYQTVFAREPGSVAAPTASLNFTDDLRQALLAKGVHIAHLTLHVGLGTFLPIRSDVIENHTMHSEYFSIPKKSAEVIKSSMINGGRIVAIGTTVARTLEYASDMLTKNPLREISGEADIFIYPGYKFKVVDVLLTNFHAPKSTVLMLAAAKAGWNNLEHAYQEAIREKYSFLSYGDSMLIL